MKMMNVSFVGCVLVASTGCGQPVRIVSPTQSDAVRVAVVSDSTVPPYPPPDMVAIEQQWTNECVEVPRLTAGERAETELAWVRRVATVARERHDRRLVGVSFPLQHRGIDIALVCFNAPHAPHFGAP